MQQEVLMRSVVLLLLAIALLVSLPALAQRNPATVSSPRAVREVPRDFALEQAALARTRRLIALLQPDAKAKLDLATRALLTHLISSPKNADPFVLAQQEVRSKFPQLSHKQSDLLSFYVLTEGARIFSNPEELKGKLDDMSNISQLDLQNTLQELSLVISMLSDIMKEISDTDETIIHNIK